MTWLRQELIQRQLGGLAFSRPVDSAALRDFIVALARENPTRSGFAGALAGAGAELPYATPG